MNDPKSARLSTFQAWAETHITGDEKGEAQIFLDRLFQGFGWAGLREAGATCEKRIKNDNGGTSFADLVWKPIVLIEMKRRGTDLSRHYRQAFDYWTHLVPNRPRYVVLCNFDDFWIYDFEVQMDVPVDTVSLINLPTKYGPLNFLYQGDVAPIFGNHQERVTRQAADKLAETFNSLLTRKIAREVSQRFILQLLMSLFSQNIGLLPRYFVTSILEECTSPQKTYDLLGGLFVAMNTKGAISGGRYRGVPYFNGGLFAEPARIELNAKERMLVKDAAQFDWSKVRPEIFGTLFEHSLGAAQRHAYGAHFTSPVDIMKIVGPTIVEPWRERIASAKTLSELQRLLNRVEKFKVLDPACGSGNFLYVAYRELKRIEATIYEKMAHEYPRTIQPSQRQFGFVSARNFFGMDINPFAVELAKVTMMLAHKLAIDELHTSEPALPLDNLDANFRAGDALINADASVAAWFPADVIIGNPPFLGAKRLKQEHSAQYVNSVRRAYPAVPGMADFCVYWFWKANDQLAVCGAKDALAGRAGLVGTQNVRNNASREGGLDHIVSTGTIVEAVDNQPWSGEANVHVSIVNWVKARDGACVPREKKLWSEVLPAPSAPPMTKGKGRGKFKRRYDLTYRWVKHISASLSDRIDTSSAVVLPCNRRPQRVFQGVTPGYDGFVLKTAEAKALVTSESKAKRLVKPYLIGREINSKDSKPKRYIIDAFGLDLDEVSRYPKTFAWLKKSVLPKVIEKLAVEKLKQSDMIKARAEHLERWWTFWAQRTDMRKWLSSHARVIAGSRTQRIPFVFSFVPSDIALGDKLQIFAFDDDYSFGIIQSQAHSEWYAAKAARLKNDVDYNYSSEAIFGTFPWPQAPSAARVRAVAEAAREVRATRERSLSGGTGVRALYAALSTPGRSKLRDAHDRLNAAVLSAYGFAEAKDILQQLLWLNRRIAAQIDEGNAVIPPGIPPGFPHPSSLVTEDVVGVQLA